MLFLGVGLAAIGSFCEEASSSIGKRQMRLRKENPFTFGLLNAVFGIVIGLAVVIFVRKQFLFSLASLPFFGLRMILEIMQAHGTVKAISLAERSTFGLIRVLTIPLLLAADVLFGKELGSMQVIGIVVIALSMAVFFMNHGFDGKGARLVLFTAINAVFTTLLFRFTITRWNSVEAETMISGCIIATYFYFQARRREHRNPFRHLRESAIALQSAAYASSGLLLGFGLLYAPAAVVMAVKRSSAVIWSVLSGTAIFHERERLMKWTAAALVVVGVILLAF